MRIYFDLIISGLMSASSLSLKVFPEKMEKDLIRSQSALCGHQEKHKGRVKYTSCLFIEMICKKIRFSVYF